MLIFFLIVFSIYFLTNFYIFIKGYRAIPEGNGYRLIYTIVFVLLALTFIAAKILERKSSSVFSDILKYGEVAQGRGIRCYFKLQERDRSKAPVRVGFAVPRKTVPLAVDRNRVRRLMREAFRLNKTALSDATKKLNRQVSLILLLKNNWPDGVRRISYQSVEHEVVEIISNIVSRL